MALSSLEASAKNIMLEPAYANNPADDICRKIDAQKIGLSDTIKNRKLYRHLAASITVKSHDNIMIQK